MIPQLKPVPTDPNPPMFNAPRFVVIFITVLVLIHVGLELNNRAWRTEAFWLFGFSSLRFAHSGEELIFNPFIKLLSFVSYSFLHSSFYHLAMNILWFFVFGTPLAKRWPIRHFLIFYCLCAIAGAVLFWVFNMESKGLLVGASGAVAGLTAASFRFMFSSNIQSRSLTIQEMFASSFVQNFFAFWLFSNVFLAMMMKNVAWEAHLGGFIAGLMLFPFFERVKQ
jgi:membrane associated rhomboid family serine protease